MNHSWNPPISLIGKTIAITGATGGLGTVLCRRLAALGADLILLDRNSAKSHTLRDTLHSEYPAVHIECIQTDLENFRTVQTAVDMLRARTVHVFIHNAGAYSIERHTCETGYDNVFQINFASPYYMIRELLPSLRKVGGHVVVVGSIAHNYSEIDPEDIDFSTRHQASKVYGNAKRYLMFALYEWFRNETAVTLAVTHPGITLTNITAHYPKWLYALIRHPMKIIFMNPEKACLSILQGISDACGYHEWIGPRRFSIWGLPKKSQLHTVSETESRQIGDIAERVYSKLKALDFQTSV